jgi:methionyl-tRNA formyltransferase
MKIIFFGTPDYADRILHQLIQTSGIEVLAVVTQPDKKIGRKQILTAPPVKVRALTHQIPIFQPHSCKKNPELVTALSAFAADYFVVAAYGQILPQEILDLPKIDCINVHGSILPAYRGASPIQSALLDGLQETGVSIMKMVLAMDAGPVYSIAKFEITPNDNTDSLMVKAAENGGKLLIQTLNQISTKQLQAVEQDPKLISFCHKIRKEDGLIDFKVSSAESIFNKFRAFTPWPGIFFFWQNTRIKIHQIEVLTQTPENFSPSKIPDFFSNNHKEIFIQCQSSNQHSTWLKVLELQPEGKKALSSKDFLNWLHSQN